MAYSRQIALPNAEPVSLAEMKQRLRVDAGYTADDTLITGLIQGAREIAEGVTGRALAKRAFTEVLDAFPYYVAEGVGQGSYPPDYYSLPRSSTSLWNYSQMIKLSNGPVLSVTMVRYVDANGVIQQLSQDTDFVLDRISEPARIFPLAGQYWPPAAFVPNAVEIDYTTGFDPNPAAAVDTHNVVATPPNQQTPSVVVPGVPQSIRDAIMAIVMCRYDNPAAALEPQFLYNLFGTNTSIDFAPTRG